jgi:hypothetical protein
MKPPDNQRLAVASCVVRHLAKLHACPNDALVHRTQELILLFELLEKASRRLAWCTSRRLSVACGRQTQQLATLARELFNQASGLMDWASTHSRMPQQQLLPRIGDVYRDLVQLEEEFDSVILDPKNHLVTVTTGPITLQEKYLGPFEIRLKLAELPRLERRIIYGVVATDPQPASSNELVTHPHVRDEELCEGDATVGIRKALESGRLCDFFLLVRSVLENYNSGSPYVALEDWEGSACQDCGCSTSSDETYYCEGCQRDFCDDCIGRCHTCDNHRCNGCLEECHDCGDALCTHCQDTCSRCSKVTCSNCLEEALCPACREKEQVPDDTDTESHDPDDGDEAGEPGTTVTQSSAGEPPASQGASAQEQPAQPAQAA